MPPVPVDNPQNFVIHTEFTEFISNQLVFSSPNCVENPSGCCSLPVSPGSGLTLIVEYSQMEGNFTVGDSWCEYNPICCTGSGNDCGVDCCPDGLPPIMHVYLQKSGPAEPFDCTADFFIVCDGENWVGTFSSGGHTITATLFASGPCFFKLKLECEGKTVISLTGGSFRCDGSPLIVEFRETSSSFPCCVSGASADWLALIFPGSSGSGGSGIDGAFLIVEYTEIFIVQPQIQFSICEDNPPDCCEPEVQTRCCFELFGQTIPTRLYATIINVTGGNADCSILEGLTIPLSHFRVDDGVNCYDGWTGANRYKRYLGADFLCPDAPYCCTAGVFLACLNGPTTCFTGDPSWLLQIVFLSPIGNISAPCPSNPIGFPALLQCDSTGATAPNPGGTQLGLCDTEGVFTADPPVGLEDVQCSPFLIIKHFSGTILNLGGSGCPPDCCIGAIEFDLVITE